MSVLRSVLGGKCSSSYVWGVADGGQLEKLRQRLTEASVASLDVFCCDKPEAISHWSVFKRFIFAGRRSGDYLLPFLFQSEIFPPWMIFPKQACLPASTGREIVPPDWSVCGRPRERDGLKFGSSCGVENKVRTEQFGSLPVRVCAVKERERELFFYSVD